MFCVDFNYTNTWKNFPTMNVYLIASYSSFPHRATIIITHFPDVFTLMKVNDCKQDSNHQETCLVKYCYVFPCALFLLSICLLSIFNQYIIIMIIVIILYQTFFFLCMPPLEFPVYWNSQYTIFNQISIHLLSLYFSS